MSTAVSKNTEKASKLWGGGTREERSGPQRIFIERWKACRSGVGAQHQSPWGTFIYVCIYK